MNHAPGDIRLRLAELEQFGIKLGLDNAVALSRRLGHPERAFPTLLVAGTNGKGSVAAMVTRALVAAGLRTGTYTSPHLLALEERVRLDGHPIDATVFSDALREIFDAMDSLLAAGVLGGPVTFFEATTAAAFECFRRSSVEIAVIEVGLGGRFDATNIVCQDVGAITTIGLDHAEQLGTTLESVAFEKAGIIKAHGVTVVGLLHAGPRAVVEQVARQRRSRVRLVADTVAARSERDGDHWTVELTTARGRYGPLRLGLRGRHQVDNARVAVAMLEELSPRFVLERTAIETGLSAASWPGRLQVLVHPDGREVIVDGAHNVEGARALAAFLADTGRAPLPIVIAVMKDKDVDGMLHALAPAASRFICTQLPQPRGLDARALAGRVSSNVAVPALAVSTIDDAIRAAFATQPRVCVAGSLYFVGELLARESAGGLW